jgi:regulator of sigma E protease
VLATFGQGAWALLWFIVAVSLLVTVHEFGHFWVARRLGFKVLRFSVGFGPALWRSQPDRDGTEYVLAAIPLGGYVKMLDDREGIMPPADQGRAFTHRPPWQRILVLLAGPLINIFFAIVLLFGVFAIAGQRELSPVLGRIAADSPAERAGLRAGDRIVMLNDSEVSGRGDVVVGLIKAMSDDGVANMQVSRGGGAPRTFKVQVTDAAQRLKLTEPENLLRGLGLQFEMPRIPPVLGKVTPGGPAALAGLVAGDEILSIDGQRIADYEAMVLLIRSKPSTELAVSYRRGAQTLATRLTTLTVDDQGQQVGRIQVERLERIPWPESMQVRKQYGVFAALAAATSESWRLTVVQAQLFWRMLTGKVSAKNLSGPISIAEFAGESARGGLGAFVSMLVMISLSLGFLNLLPIPVLDGGQIVYQSAEWLRGSPLSERTQALGQQVGIALLVLLMGVAFFNDIVRQLQG